MAGQTANLALPYPVATDRITDGDNSIKSFADRMDALGVGTAAYPSVSPATLNAAAGVSGTGSYLLRNGVVHCEFGFAVGSGGAAQGIPLSVALPAGFHPLVRVFRMCQGAGILRGVYVD